MINISFILTYESKNDLVDGICQSAGKPIRFVALRLLVSREFKPSQGYLFVTPSKKLYPCCLEVVCSRNPGLRVK